jgi:tight adherence protein B
MDIVFYLFGTFLFLAVVLLLEGAYLSWNAARGPEAKRMERRLVAMSAGAQSSGEEYSIFKSRVLSESAQLHNVLLGLPRVHSLDRLLLQSGVSMTVAKFLGWTLAAFVGAFVVAQHYTIVPIVPWCAAVAASGLPLFYVLRAKRKRMVRLEHQLPDAVDLIGRALRAGHAFPNAVKMVGDEMSDPIAGEFKIMFDEVNYGVSMQNALLNLATRIPSMDVKYMVIAVLIQRDTGGNLAELFDNISTIVRERLKLLGQVRVLSAEGRMSALVLSLLPFGTAGVINLVNPQFMSLLWTDPAGLKMVWSALGLMLAGMLWMRKIIRIHV